VNLLQNYGEKVKLDGMLSSIFYSLKNWMLALLSLFLLSLHNYFVGFAYSFIVVEISVPTASVVS